ncbi:alpha/beta hydrolase [Mycolicibacter arupensis]|uniref:alpha/beta hydrolase n=1 Tax=Mycolicibacter arupensis TaxID=342002 RepID=UPI003B3ACEE0
MTVDAVVFESTSIDGEPMTQTGLVWLPDGPPPASGWPVVTYGHMTTGGSDRAAPSLATPGHPESRRIHQGDAFVSRLAAAGAVVLQPDYEGLGSPGPHPYLRGDSLGRSVRDLLTWARERWPLDGRWISAGHSEGAMAAMHAVAGGPVDGFDLRAVVAFAPVTRMSQTIGAALRLPVVLPGFQVVTALIALMIDGAATTSAPLRRLLDDGGLSGEALALWPQLGERSLVELCARDSFGALAPRALLGPRGAEVRQRLLDSFNADEVADLRLPAGVPLRIDAGRFDEVAPFWLTRRLTRLYRARGTDVELHWWNGMHSPTVDLAAAAAALWCAEKLWQ